MKIRSLLEGCGIGVVLTLILTWGQLSPAHVDDLYHRMLPINSVAGGAAIDLAAAAVLASLLVWWLHRRDPANRSVLWAILAAGVTASFLNTVLTLAEHFFKYLKPFGMFLILAALLTGLWWFKRKWYSYVIQGFQALCLCIGFCMVWMLPELIVVANRPQPHDVQSFEKPVPKADVHLPRVVWVVFDELSYDLLFDHRQPGMEFPAFDKLRAQSVSFSHVEPQGYYTEDIFPSLLLGKDVDDIRSSFAGALSVHTRQPKQWQRWDEGASIFGDAKRAGWTTGVAGWYNPYCRILKDTLDSCAWDMEGIFRGHMSSTDTALGNALAPMSANFRRFRGKSSGIAGTPFGMHSENYQYLMQAGLKLVKNEDIRFVMVHLPIPHPSGIYNRRTHQIAPNGSYLDNLVLTDEALGALRDAIASTGSADSTMLVVSSDHSWRVPLWRFFISWTAEDERVSQHGKFEKRPVLMVHFPGETSGRQIDASFPGIEVHGILEAMVRGEMRSPEDLERWAGQQK